MKARLRAFVEQQLLSPTAAGRLVSMSSPAVMGRFLG
jgi:hypothetical protein